METSDDDVDADVCSVSITNSADSRESEVSSSLSSPERLTVKSFFSEIYYYIVALILTLTLLIFISILEMLYRAPAPPVTNKINYDATTLQLIGSLDLTIDPCQDFYKFACGGWENNLSLRDLMIVGIKKDVLDLLKKDDDNCTTAFKMAKTVYKSCMNIDAVKEVGMAPLIELLDSYGGWPIISPKWNENNFDWKKASSSLRIQLGIHVFFTIATSIDWNNANKTIIKIFRSPVSDEPLQKLKKLISHRPHPPQISEIKKFKSDLNDLNIFRAKLKSIPTLSKWTDSSILRLSDLQQVTDNPREMMNWTEYLNDVFSVLNFTVAKDERIMVDVNYLSKLFQLLNDTPMRVIANYFHLMIVENIIEDTEEGLKNLEYNLIENRETFCFFKMQLVEPAIISEYINNFFTQEQRQEIKLFIGYLKTTISQSLKEWDMPSQMDPFERIFGLTERLEMLSKMQSMKALVGYPDWIDNDALLNSYYRELEVMDEKSYFQNICNIKRFAAIKGFKAIRRPRAIEDDLSMDERFGERALLINMQSFAFYNLLTNNIVVSLSLLREPYYRKEGLKASIYGSIGFVLGHEIGHSIVTEKIKMLRKYAETAELTPGMAKPYIINAGNKIGKQIQCFVDQYSNYKIDELNKHLDGLNTYQENIADYIGLTQAFGAYQKHIDFFGSEDRLPGLEQFSPEQIFFISFASKFCRKYANNEELSRIMKEDVHSVLPYRVNGAVSNSKAFSEHFKCPVNSPMNPVRKCTLEKREDREFKDRLRMINEL